MKKTTLILLGIISIALILATTQTLEAQTYKWKVGTIMSEREPATLAEARFCELVTQRTGGKVKLTSVTAGGLGDDRALFEGCERGDLPIAATCASTSLDPRFGAMYLARLARDYDEAEKIFYGDGVIAQIVKEIHGEHNQMVLAFNEIGFRGLNTNFPFKSLAEVKGAKIRVPGIRPMQIFIEELGCLTISMSMTDLMEALMRKVADGQENSIVTTYASGYFEFCRHYVELDYSYGTHQIVMNKKIFDSMPKEIQRAILNSAEEAQAYGKKLYRDKLKSCKEDAIKRWGVKFYKLTDRDKALAEAAAARAMERCKKELPAGIVERIMTAVAKARGQ